MAKQSARCWFAMATAPALAIAVIVLVIPVALLLASGLHRSGGPPAAVLATAAMGSVTLSAAAATIATAVGLAVAVACRSAGERLRAFVATVSMVPLSLSVLVTAFAFVLLFGRSGTVTLGLAGIGIDPRQVAGWFYGPVGLAVVYVHMLAPRALMTLSPVVDALDMDVFRAARSLGAGPWRAARDALWPQVAPAAMSAWSLCFAVGAGSYAAALVLLGTKAPLLAVLLVAQLGDSATDLSGAGIIAICVIGLCIGATALANVAHRTSQVGGRA